MIVSSLNANFKKKYLLLGPTVVARNIKLLIMIISLQKCSFMYSGGYLLLNFWNDAFFKTKVY